MYLKKLFIYFNWMIITLQYCDCFCHTSIWIGHRHTCVPSILKPPLTSFPTPSLQVVTEHRLWVPCVIHQTPTICFTYGNVYVSMLVSQIKKTVVSYHKVGGNALTTCVLSSPRASSNFVKGSSHLFSFHTTCTCSFNWLIKLSFSWHGLVLYFNQ